MRAARVTMAVGMAGVLAACGGGGLPSGGSGTSASLTLTANPDPIAGVLCARCGAGSTDRESVTSLTIRETAGVGGTVLAIAMTLRANATNAVLASGEFDTAAVTSLAGSSRVPGRGTLVVPSVGVHYPGTQAGQAATLTYTVRVRDDHGNQVSRDLSVTVSAT